MRLKPVYFTLLISLLFHAGLFFIAFFGPSSRPLLQPQASSLPMITFKVLKSAPATVLPPVSNQTAVNSQLPTRQGLQKIKNTPKNTPNSSVSSVLTTSNNATTSTEISIPSASVLQPSSLPVSPKKLQYLSGNSLLGLMHTNAQKNSSQGTLGADQSKALSAYRALVDTYQKTGLDTYIKKIPGPYQNLQRQEDGSYEYKHTHFVAHIRENGEVVFKDPISVGYVLGITEHLMRKAGNDPYLSQKNEFLDAVKSFRQELRVRYEQTQQIKALSILGQKLDSIVRSQLPLDAKKQQMLNLLEGCDPNTETGKQAISLIQSKIALLQ